MYIVVDSGSTKTDWAVVRDKKVEIFQTKGINPNTQPDAMIAETIGTLAPLEGGDENVKAIYFYGAGIWCKELEQRMERQLTERFSRARARISHDLLGAARASCLDEKGIACILGTGSNSCLYDGCQIVDSIHNLGWMLGDEGSGMDIGKRLVRAYCYRKLSAEEANLVESETGLTRSEILIHLYQRPAPNLFLSSLSPTVRKHFDMPGFRQIVEEAFRDFLTIHVKPYEGSSTLPINFVGSVARHYAEVLEEVCAELELTFGRTVHRPIDNLLSFHKASTGDCS